MPIKQPECPPQTKPRFSVGRVLRERAAKERLRATKRQARRVDVDRKPRREDGRLHGALNQRTRVGFMLAATQEQDVLIVREDLTCAIEMLRVVIFVPDHPGRRGTIPVVDHPIALWVGHSLAW